jgi:hypothetical protein
MACGAGLSWQLALPGFFLAMPVRNLSRPAHRVQTCKQASDRRYLIVLFVVTAVFFIVLQDFEMSFCIHVYPTQEPVN